MTQHILTFRATVPVEPFRINRSTVVYHGSQRGYETVPYEFEVTVVQLYVFANEGTDEQLQVGGYRIKKNGERYAVSGTEYVSWFELPEQAKEAARAAYAEATANVVLVLNGHLA